MIFPVVHHFLTRNCNRSINQISDQSYGFCEFTEIRQSEECKFFADRHFNSPMDEEPKPEERK